MEGHSQNGSSSTATFGTRRGSSAYSTQERLYNLDHEDSDEDEVDNEEEEDGEDEDDALSSETRPLAKTAASKRSVLSDGKAFMSLCVKNS